jgi:hypothetical protein
MAEIDEIGPAHPIRPVRERQDSEKQPPRPREQPKRKPGPAPGEPADGSQIDEYA